MVGPYCELFEDSEMTYSPWKVGIGATWRTPPVAPGITGGPIRGHEICCNQSEFPVRLAESAKFQLSADCIEIRSIKYKYICIQPEV